MEKDYIIPAWLYPYMKWAAMLFLPALSTLVLAVGGIWGLGWAQPVAATVTAVGAFVGALVGVSQATAKGGASDEGASR